MEKISKTVNIWNYISFIDQKIRSDGINNLLNYVLIKNEKKNAQYCILHVLEYEKFEIIKCLFRRFNIFIYSYLEM